MSEQRLGFEIDFGTNTVYKLGEHGQVRSTLLASFSSLGTSDH